MKITAAEWEEIMQLSEIREGWGIEDCDSAEQFLTQVYGVKFEFHSGCPGYTGDLFIIQGDILIGEPISLLRKKGLITVVQ